MKVKRHQAKITQSGACHVGKNGRWLIRPEWGFGKGNKAAVGRRNGLTTLSGFFKQRLNETCHYDPAKRKWGEVIAAAVCWEAAAGRIPAVTELRVATEGNPVNVSTDWRKEVEASGIDPDQLLDKMVQHALELQQQKRDKKKGLR